MPEYTDKMRAEWEAWKAFCKEFRKIHGDINDPKNSPMVQAIRLWGEELVSLRETQTEPTKRSILEVTRANYKP